MSLDLNAAGAKFIAGTGGGTSSGDPLLQTIQVSQAGIGAIPVAEAALEASVGGTADASWVGTGVASLVALLKAVALRWGVGGVVQDGGGSITTNGVAQNVFGGTTPVNGYLIQNTSGAVLYISDVATASPTTGMLLNPAAMWVTPPGYKPPGAVSIYGAASGQSYVARRW